MQELICLERAVAVLYVQFTCQLDYYSPCARCGKVGWFPGEDTALML